MDSVLNRLPKSTFELTITLPWTEVKAHYDKLASEFVKEVEVEGFRKGKAPRKMAEDKIDKDKIFREVVKQVVPEAYLESVKKHDLHPIVNPKIELVAFKEGADWVFKATSCEKPEVKIGEYKEEVKKITAKSKIILPGKEPQPPKIEDILKVILEKTEVDIPDLLLESEVNRLLAKFLDEIKALGLTLEQYLSSIGKTPDQLRGEYTQKSANDLKFEFILDKIADQEKIVVTGVEIEEAIKKNEDKKTQDSLRQNTYLLASLIRQQKTLDFVKNL